MDKATLVRIIVFALAWLNSFLASKGYETLPVVDETQVAMFVTFVISVWVFVSHNFFGKKGKKQKEVLDRHGLK